jgi:hypothetical protein
MTTAAIPISMPLRDWLFIDAEMDNSGQNAMEVDDHRVATTAGAIREIGWDATGHVTRPLAEAGRWPPDDDVMGEQVTVTLTTTNWWFVVDHLRIGGNIAESVDHPADAAWGRALADRIAESVTGQATR